MKIVCASDTHNCKIFKQFLPEGDVFIHAGDSTNYGTRAECESFAKYLSSLNYRFKIVIAGNHDKCLQEPDNVKEIFSSRGIIYLQDSGVVFENVLFYGTPWTSTLRQDNSSLSFFKKPKSHHLFYQKDKQEQESVSPHNAFSCADTSEFFNQIPLDTNVLITHTPPYGVLDFANNNYCGDKNLLDRVDVVKPKFHIFGHVHEGYGFYKKNYPSLSTTSTPSSSSTTFINASICDEDLSPRRRPISFII